MRLIACGMLVMLAACSTGQPDLGPRFDDESAARNATGELPCMKHQPEPPGLRYTDRTRRRTDDTLLVLRYYTANGTKSYCDSKGPTDTDRQWLQLYVDLGADRSNVATLLDGR
ncbi:hypothetical protein [Actinophytocola sp. NPDC049390]|uniref:hypothetical protein n=1 Tax=Actinophytocola sp. NPDC049390 TaxID=3363894 RepID=UPI0037A72F26